jgi:3',5'-cyclic AMP phosphodiesterase CpdA
MARSTRGVPGRERAARPTRVAVALAALLLAALLAGCGGRDEPEPAAAPAAGGSTRAATWVDRDGDGTLERGPGEALRPRAALGHRERPGRELARVALVTDAHVRDEESPARPTFLDRLGSPFESTFRPQESLTAQVLAAQLRALRAERPRQVLVAGDLVDNAQANELDQALAVLRGGGVRPDSGARGYRGVQEADNPDPFFYRPDVDPPRHPGLLDAAQRPFRSLGAGVPWLPALGNHDWLAAGEVPATPTIQARATGGTAIADVDLEEALAGLDVDAPDPQAIDAALAAGLPGREVRVPADAARRLVDRAQAVERLREASGVGATDGRLDYVRDLAPGVRLVVLDTEAARAEGLAAGAAGAGLGDGETRRGADGAVLTPAQLAWLDAQLAAAGERWVLVLSHRRLDAGAHAVLARHPRVVAALHGDTHRHAIEPVGRVWQIGTASLADWPQQGRMLALNAAPSGGVVLDTWTVDHAGGRLAGTSRELAFLDAQGGRPQGDAGERADRNARLFRSAP